MRIPFRPFVLAAALVLCLAGAAETSSYGIRMPQVVDPLHRFSVVVILHDAGGSGSALLDDERIVAGFIDRGYAVLAPDALARKNRNATIIGGKPGALDIEMNNVRGSYSDKRFLMRDRDGSVRPLRWGRDTGWYYYNIDRLSYSDGKTPSEYFGRDEIDFLRRALADAARSQPIDPNPVLIVGLGHGGSLVWQIACRAPRLARLLAPVGGAYWDALPAGCARGADLIHTHHRADRFWPLEGASGSRKRYARTPVGDNLALLLRANLCHPVAQTISDAAAGATRTLWTDCTAGGPVELVLLDRPFAFQQGWLDRIHERLDGFGLAQPFDTPEVPVETRPRFSRPGETTGPAAAAPDGAADAPAEAPEAEAGSRFKAPGAGTGSRFKSAGERPASRFKRVD